MIETLRRGLSRRTRAALLLGGAAVTLVAIALRAPLPQDPAYSLFADTRLICGVPNFGDTVSNLAFLLVGLWGLAAIVRGRCAIRDPGERQAWLAMYAAIALVGLGSAWYHWAPDNNRLVWDRLPIAAAIMALLAAQIGERIDLGVGRRLLWPLVAGGVASVLWWHATESMGRGNVLWYFGVQGYGLLAILLAIALFAPRYSHGGHVVAGLLLYALAKAAEANDLAIFQASGGIVSGHTCKHLIAAAAVALPVRMLLVRRPLGD